MVQLFLAANYMYFMAIKYNKRDANANKITYKSVFLTQARTMYLLYCKKGQGLF